MECVKKPVTYSFVLATMAILVSAIVFSPKKLSKKSKVRERLLHTARMSFLLASEDTGVFNVPVVIVPRYPCCTSINK